MFRFHTPPSWAVQGSRSYKIYPSRFNPYLPDPRFYWRVRIFATEEQMWTFSQWRHGGEMEQDFGAMCIPCYKMTHGGKLFPKLGEIIFFEKSLMPEVISHESLHAACATIRTLFGGSEAVTLGEQNGDPEERLAYTLGSLVRQIVDHS